MDHVLLHTLFNTLFYYFSEIGENELFIETEIQNDTYSSVQGRRLVDISHFIQQLQNISSHNSLFNCNFTHMALEGEKRNGLISKYKFRCNMCKKDFMVTSEDLSNKDNVNANVAAVTGITSAGIGYSQFEEITACMDVPIFVHKNYAQIQDMIYEKWESTAVESMAAAANRERDAAVAEGKLSKDGIPVIDVYADACWSSRSYGNNYKALSGAAAIVGRKFGEVLFVGIKNKYCLICARAEKKQIATPEHICYKNYTGSSSGMESEIVCQGFESSVAMYNVIYGRLIADGDSATYAKILARDPYPTYTVQKIECRNHLLRNMCNKLRAMTKDTKYALAHRKTLTEIKIMSIRKVVVASVKPFKSGKDKPEAVANFRKEVQNSIYHAFGNHENCKDFYCSKEKTIQSNMEIKNTTFWFRILTILQSLTAKSRSMLEDVDTNAVERFNSVIAKVVGGKRINFSLRRGYRARCNAAVVSFNNDHPRHLLHKKILGRSPRSLLKNFEERRLKKKILNKTKPHKKNRMLKRDNTVQHDYGTQSTTPDLTADELNRAKESFLQNLSLLTSDKEKIQLSTINQRDSDDWIELRKNMITASNFGLVVKRRENTSKAKLVENILYKSNLSHIAAIAHGVDNEHLALQQLAIQENVTIRPCGLFVDPEYPFIGASPDGLIDQDSIVEIKCPIVAFKNGLEESIKKNKIQIWKYNKKKKLIELNKNSNWYHQIQGQLHVTQREKCLFAVWSGENQPLKTEIIRKDHVFWEKKMKDKLVSFYMDWLLPEIVDSRRARGMPLREKENPSIDFTSTSNKNNDNEHGIVDSPRSRRMPLREQESSLDRPMVDTSLRDDSKHEEPLPKKRRISKEFSISPCYSSDDNKENELGCCSRQIIFEEF